MSKICERCGDEWATLPLFDTEGHNHYHLCEDCRNKFENEFMEGE